jgi:threonine dehydrogenase-like Zn-dependent dehydrogenase
MKVAVLGCGPAGLLAAHAVALAGHEPVILSVKQKSRIPGAVYLHERIPYLTPDEPEGHITFHRLGERDGYARKVYGNALAPVSWDTFPAGAYEAWSMMRLYDKLWDTYGDLVEDVRMTEDVLHRVELEYKLVISSIPAKTLCHNPYHFFNGVAVWITNFAADLCPDNAIIYSGDEDHDWYRTSRIFGHGATEYAKAVTHVTQPDWPQIVSTFAGTKPTGTNCDCHERIKRVGRFGRWEKGVLVHHAFRQAVDILNGAEVAA